MCSNALASWCGWSSSSPPRFLAYYAAKNLSAEFEWQWRLDDDSYITEVVGYDVFELMAQNKKRYGFTNIVQDDDKCVLGLWDAARSYIDQNKLETTFFTRYDEALAHWHPLTGHLRMASAERRT